MSGYLWNAVFKFVPTDGPEETLSVKDTFTDLLGGPKQVHPSHDLEQTAKKDSNRRGVSRNWGARGKVQLDFEIVTMDQHAYLVLILNRLMSDAFTCYLSLDGGLNYREVELAPNGYKGPKALQGKTFMGAAYELTVQAVELIDAVPAIGTGTW